MVKLDEKEIHSKSNVDLKLLLEIFEVITSKTHQNSVGFNLKKATYQSKDKLKSGTFDLVTISLSN